MDRISKALERAKQNVKDTGNSVDARNVGGVRKKSKDVVPSQPINYSTTRQISLSPELLRENRIFTRGADSSIIDTYGLLRTRVLSIMRKNNWKTLGVTGPEPSVGKTVTSINLAISIAFDHNYSTLLVDTDLRRPGIASALGMNVETGLSDFLLDKSSLDETLVNPGIEHLVIAPTKHVPSHSSELLSSPRMSHFIDEAKTRYSERLVIFDLPPVLVGDDVVALSHNLDAILLVVADGKTQSRELSRALELLRDSNILGVVLNMGTVANNQYEYYK